MEYTPLLLLAFVIVSWCDVLCFMLLQNHPVSVQLLHQSKKEQKINHVTNFMLGLTFMPVELES